MHISTPNVIVKNAKNDKNRKMLLAVPTIVNPWPYLTRISSRNTAASCE
jgi:hypothetical protein